MGAHIALAGGVVHTHLLAAGSTIWVTDEQGHGPIILGLALWYIASSAA